MKEHTNDRQITKIDLDGEDYGGRVIEELRGLSAGEVILWSDDLTDTTEMVNSYVDVWAPLGAYNRVISRWQMASARTPDTSGCP